MIQSLGLFHIFPFIVLVHVASSQCPCSFPPHVIMICPMRTLNPWVQQYLLGSIGTESLLTVALGGFGDLVTCVLASRKFVATIDFTCATSVLLVSTNFMFMAIRSATMLRSAVAASAIFSSAVAISVVSWASWALLNPASPNTHCCSLIL